MLTTWKGKLKLIKKLPRNASWETHLTYLRLYIIILEEEAKAGHVTKEELEKEIKQWNDLKDFIDKILHQIGELH